MSSITDSTSMNTAVSNIAVDLSTEIILAVVLKVDIIPMATPASKKYSLLCTQTSVNSDSMAKIDGTLITDRVSMTNEVIEELTKQLTIYVDVTDTMNTKTYSFTIDTK